MDQSDPVPMRDYGFYPFWWYMRHCEDCTQHCTVEFHFYPEIRYMNQDVKLGKMFLVRPLMVKNPYTIIKNMCGAIMKFTW